MGNFFNRVSIGKKLITANAIIVAIGLIILSFTIFVQERNVIIQENNSRVQTHLDDLESIFSLQIKEKQSQVKNSLSAANFIIEKYGQPRLSDSIEVNITAVNQITKQETSETIPEMTIGDTEINGNFEIVDKIKAVTDQTATLFQRIDQGFIRISTNVLKLDGQRAVGTYIPNSSPVIQSIKRGETFLGRAYVVNDWYQTAYQPITINGSIEGILYVGVKEKDMQFLEDNFKKKSYFESGYPYAITGAGELLLHPTSKGKSIASTKLFENVKNNEGGVYKGKLFGDEEESSFHFFTYFEPSDTYLVVSVPESELITARLNGLLFTILLGAVIILLVVLVLINILSNKIVINPLLEIRDRLNSLASRKHTETLEISTSDEIGEIKKSVNSVVTGLSEASSFAQKVGEGEFVSDFKPLSDDDILGNSLLNMKINLERAAQEDNKRNWANEGYSEFVDILRKSNESVAGMCQALLPVLIGFLKANQGAIFVTDSDDNETVLSLKAAYAWQREKHLEDTIVIKNNITQDLIGQAFVEKKAIFLKNIPDNYVKIKSGLGDANPRNIIILPLMYNEEVFGVMEIATFNEMEEYEVQFLERISESIASTISTLNVNEKTNLLLADTREQAEQLQSQEEEMRQNLEEMTATQENYDRNKSEWLEREQLLMATIEDFSKKK